MTRTIAAILAGALVTVASPAAAQTIELKLADTLPNGHTMHQAVTNGFIRNAEAAVTPQLKLRHYPGGQLGKGTDSLRLIQLGMQDIGQVSASLVSDKLPLTAVVELPGLWRTSCEATLALWAMSQDGGFLEKQEYAPNGVRALATMLLPGYQIMVSSGREIKGLSDLAGLKLRSAGGALERMVASLNASPVRLAAPEMYEALSRGTADGALFSYQAATSYKLTKLIKTSTEGQSLGTIMATYFISDQKWKSLPANIQTALLESGRKATVEGCKSLDDAENTAKDELRAAGVKFIKLNKADQDAIDKTNVEVQQQWAQDLDRKGKPGTEALNAFKAALKN